MPATALDLLAGYGEGRWSPREVIRESLARAVTVGREFGAIWAVDQERAEAEATQAQQRLTEPGARHRWPLLGIPLVVKDCIDTAAITTTYGSAMFAEHRPSQDAEVVRRMRDAGAIVVAKAAAHEFCWGFTTQNRHFGSTHNPLDPLLIPGGSSGGSAAAVALRIAPIALGTDTCGSIRLPASWCGVAGLKLSHAAVPTKGVFPLAPSLDHLGAIAATAADLQLTHRTLVDSGRPGPPVTALSRLSIGILDEALPMDPEIADAWQHTVQRLREHGASLRPVKFALHEAAEATRVILLREGLRVHRNAGLYPARAKEYGADVRQRLLAAERVSEAEYVQAQSQRRRLREQVHEIFHGTVPVDVVLSPVAQMAPPAIARLSESGQSERIRDSALRCLAWQNLVGAPTVSLVAGRTPSAAPIGIQVTGAGPSADRVLAAAAVIEKILSHPRQERPPR